jgi:hypothetical protein
LQAAWKKLETKRNKFMTTPAPATDSSKNILFETAAGQKATTTGIQGFTNASPVNRNPNAVSPNAIRWLINPFAHINISMKPDTGPPAS